MHVGIIMDGNGRWASDLGWPRALGHRKGARTVTDIVKACPDLGIESLTLYAFSTENWNRSAHEVASLMRLFRGYLQNKFVELVEKNVRVIFLGDPTPVAKDIVVQMRRLEKATKQNNGLTLNIALNYGGRDEIIRAAKKFGRDVKLGNCNVDNLTVEKFETYLDTKGQKSPDIIIRTAGEQRLSNFLLWQAAYSELYFTKLTWPEFSAKHLEEVLKNFSGRSRTFGKEKLSSNN